jgi:hypothetical protein
VQNMTVSDLENDVDDVWDLIAGGSYSFNEDASIRAMLRTLVVKDLRRFYHQYVARSSGTVQSMCAQLLVQVVVADWNAAADTHTSQSSPREFSKSPELNESHGSRGDMGKGVQETHLMRGGRGRHKVHSGAGHTGCTGAHGVGASRGTTGVTLGSMGCCRDIQVNLLDSGSSEGAAVSSDNESLQGHGAMHIVDVEKWKASQAVYPRHAGKLPR